MSRLVSLLTSDSPQASCGPLCSPGGDRDHRSVRPAIAACALHRWSSLDPAGGAQAAEHWLSIRQVLHARSRLPIGWGSALSFALRSRADPGTVNRGGLRDGPRVVARRSSLGKRVDDRAHCQRRCLRHRGGSHLIGHARRSAAAALEHVAVPSSPAVSTRRWIVVGALILGAVLAAAIFLYQSPFPPAAAGS